MSQTDTQPLIDHIKQGDFLYGESYAAHLDGQHPANTVRDGYPERRLLDSTVEYYSFAPNKEGVKTLGAVATSFSEGVKNTPQDGYEFVSPFAEASGFFEVEATMRHFGPNTLLEPVAQAVGIHIQVAKTDEKHEQSGHVGRTEIAATYPATASDVNMAWLQLGITDRWAIDFEGGIYTAIEALEALAQGNILLSTDRKEGIHDRLFHIMAFSLLSPKVFAKLQSHAADLLIKNSHYIEKYGNTPGYNMDPRANSERFMAQRAIGDFMGKIDFLPVKLAEELSGTKGTHDKLPVLLTSNIGDLLSGLTNAEQEELAEDTIAWRNELIKRAANPKYEPTSTN